MLSMFPDVIDALGGGGGAATLVLEQMRLWENSCLSFSPPLLMINISRMERGGEKRGLGWYQFELSPCFTLALG